LVAELGAARRRGGRAYKDGYWRGSMRSLVDFAGICAWWMEEKRRQAAALHEAA